MAVITLILLFNNIMHAYRSLIYSDKIYKSKIIKMKFKDPHQMNLSLTLAISSECSQTILSPNVTV